MRPMHMILTMPALLLMMASAATAQDRPFRPHGSGSAARYDGWNSDGAPRPPRIWRGHGGTRWADHYRACRKAYGNRYDYRSDMVRRGGRRMRCSL